MYIWRNLIEIPCRQFTTSHVKHALCWPKPDYGPSEVHRSDFLNGMRIAAARPTGSEMCACCIMFQAGSRSECDHYLGATHFIRASTNLTGLGFSGFIKSRVLQEYGGYITCSSDRQSIAFTLRCPPPTFDKLRCYLLDVAARCTYRDFELDGIVKPIIKEELLRRPPEQHCLDLIQTAVWGGPLANSVYCKWGRVDDMSENILRNYTHHYFTTNNCTIGTIGLPFDQTLAMAESLDCGGTDKPQIIYQPPSFPRAGFEYHDLGACADTYVALAVPGVGTCNMRAMYLYAILAEAMGTSYVFKGSHSWTNIPHLPTKRQPLEPYTQFKAFSISYLDKGVFGILVKSKASAIRDNALGAANLLRNIGTISCEQIEVGKRRLKVSLAFHDDDPVMCAEGLALQLANNYKIDSAKCSMDIINSIPSAEVKAVAQNLSVMTNAMATAVVGDVASAPDSGELMCG